LLSAILTACVAAASVKPEKVFEWEPVEAPPGDETAESGQTVKTPKKDEPCRTDKTVKPGKSDKNVPADAEQYAVEDTVFEQK
ncbi:MAG: hypothetical protein IKI41_05950, partial [Clostridia bacterium]|nr:hypothetical protein [Clostridia bacterium]